MKGTVPKRLDICYDFSTFSNILNFYFLIVVTSATQHTKFLSSFIKFVPWCEMRKFSLTQTFFIVHVVVLDLKIPKTFNHFYKSSAACCEMRQFIQIFLVVPSAVAKQPSSTSFIHECIQCHSIFHREGGSKGFLAARASNLQTP